MKNAINDVPVVNVTLAAAVASGEFFMVQNMLLVAATAGEIGDEIACYYKGNFRDAPKPNDEAWTQLEALYWDDAAGEFTTDDGGGANPAVAVARADAAQADTEGQVILLPAAAL